MEDWEKEKKKKNSLNQMRTVGALPFFIQLIEKEKGKKTSGVIYAWDFQVNLRL